MGDCEKGKCIQEKRSFKRELLSWFKKVPYVTGLELVAENLAGGCIKTLLFPFNEMEPKEPKDFGEDADALCVFCEGKDTSSLDTADTSMSIAQVELSLPPASALNPVSETHLTKVKNKEPNDSSKQLTVTPNSSAAAAAGETSAASDVEGLNSFYNQLAMTSLLYQQHQHLQSAAMAAAVQEAKAALSGSYSGKQQGEARAREERPLDLTSSLGADVSGSSLELGELRIPEIKPKKKDRSMKKNYSDRELNAAVEAIKSGAIGTRRAAQLYGIPRSTLRNKVFKSAEMNKSQSDGLGQPNASAVALELDKNGSVADTSKPERKSPKLETDTSSNTLPSKAKSDNADMAQYSHSFLRHLEELRAKQNFNEQLTAASNNRLFADMFNPLQMPSSYNPFLMPQYAGLGASIPGYEYLNPFGSSLMMPYLNELLKIHTQKRLEMEQVQQPPRSRTRQEVSPSLSSSKRESASRSTNLAVQADEIKIPEYKPAIGLSLDPPSSLPSVDAIKHTISNSSASPNVSSSYLQNLLPFQDAPAVKRQANMESPVPHKRSRGEHARPSDTNNANNSNGTTPMGKKRPKRGQYRKYDSELLAQAVRAVQRGEMSVHRAGTFFGVPHSTLEYKVKERHLLRKKKMAENSENKTGTASSSLKPISSSAVCPYSSDSSQSTKCLDNSMNSLNTDANQIPEANTEEANSGATNGVLENKFLDFTTPYEKCSEISTPASQLLKRLHERAHKRAAELFNAQNNSKETESAKLVESLTN